MKNKKQIKLLLLVALLPFVILIIIFELAPAVAMLMNSFRTEDAANFTLQQYITSLSKPFYLKAIKNSLMISLYSSVIGLIVGLLVAYAITRVSESIREKVIMISNMTSNFAGIPLAFAYIILLGTNGIFTILANQFGWSVFTGFDLYTWTGLALVYVYFQIPLATLLLFPIYNGIREGWKEAASLLGAGKFQFWRYIALPVLLPAIAGTFTVLFANSMGAYATAYALVGGNYNLLAIRIGSLISGNVITNPQLGSALAVLLGVTMMLSLWINERLMRRVRRDIS
jgi:putative spermidine/putrescine transport system permease protein